MADNFNNSSYEQHNLYNNDSDSDCELDEEDGQRNGTMGYVNSQTQNDKRNFRNQNEKNRRDEFNNLIQELAAFIDSDRKIDKISVLSETINYFHNNNFKLKDKEISNRFKPFFLQNHEFITSLFGLKNAFCLVFDLNGLIKYVSNEVSDLLNLEPERMQYENILDLVDEKSAKRIRIILKNKHSSEEIIDFDCRFKSNKSFTEIFKVNGCFKLTPHSNIESIGHFNTIARMNPALRIAKYSAIESNIFEFQSKIYFSLDLKFTRVDTEITKLIGYGQMELLGTSIYDYCHIHDLEKLADCHQELNRIGDQFSLSLRMLSKGEQILIVDTVFIYIEPNSIICKIKLPKINSRTSNDTELPNFNGNTINLTDKRRASNHDISFENINKLKRDDITFPNNSHDHFNKSMSESSMDSQAKQSETKIDESLATIFLRSYNDISYRHYVLNLLRNKRNGVQKSISKQQDELKILDETIDNINDPKKLGSWLNEFQNNKIKNNILKNSQHQM